jgi:hypothetical protein
MIDRISAWSLAVSVSVSVSVSGAPMKAGER